MFCEKCGANLPENAKFCESCGAPVAVEAAPVQEVETVAEPIGETVVPTPPVKKKKIWPIIVGVVAVVLVAGFFLRESIINLFMNLMPAETQLRYAYSKVLEESADELATAYDDFLAFLKDDKETLSGAVELEVDGNVLKMATGSGEDVAIKVDYVFARKNNEQFAMDLTASADGEALVQAKIGVDLKEGILSAECPDLTDEALVMDLDEMLMDAGMEDVKPEEVALTVDELVALMPESKILRKSLPNILGAALKEIKEVEKSKETVEAGDVEQKLTCYTVEITPETALNMINAVIDAIKTDKDIESYVVSLWDKADDFKGMDVVADALKDVRDMAEDELDVSSGKDLYKEFIKVLDDAQESLEDIEYDDEDEAITMSVYTASGFDIVGSKIEAPDGSVAMNIKAEDGNQVGYEYAYNDGETNVNIVANGTEKRGKFNGTVEIKNNDQSVLEIECTDFDTDAFEKDGHIIGKFALSVPAAQLELDITAEFKITDKECNISIDAGSFGSLKLTSQTKDSASVKVETDGNDDVEDWVSGFDTEDLMEKLQDIPLVDALMGVSQSATVEARPYDDDGYSYYDYEDDYPTINYSALD